MKTITITFSLRDWKQGAELLLRLGHLDQMMLTETHTLELELWQIEDLQDECEALDLEFEIEGANGISDEMMDACPGNSNRPFNP